MKNPPQTGKGLNPKQKRFALEMLVDNDRVRSYYAAGYKGNKTTAYTRASRLLQNVKIKAFIDKHEKALIEKLELKAEDVLLRYKHIAYSNIGQVASWTKRKVNLIPSVEIAPEVMVAIAEVKETPGGGLSVKMRDSLEALNKIGEHLKMWKAPDSNVLPGSVLDNILVYVPAFVDGPVERDRRKPVS